MKKFIIPLVVLIAFSSAGYVWAGMPNPADIYCSELGYHAETITENDGGQHSVCIFPDGSSCDSWRFFEGRCGETYSYCAQKGYELKVKTDGKNPFSFSQYYAVCVDKQGKEIGSVTDLMGFQKKYMKPLNLPESYLQESYSTTTALNGGLDGMSGVDLMGAALPSSFDWRTYLGFDWTTPPKNQSSCGACWAFSPVGVTEAAYNIKTNIPNLDLNLSEEYLNSDCDIVESSNDAGSCCGGSHQPAMDFIKNYGIPDEACLRFNSTYHSNGNPCDCFGKATGCPLICSGMPTNCSQYLCEDRCTDYASRLFSITDYFYVAKDNAGIKQKLIEKGPLSVCLSTRWSLDPQTVFRCTWCWDRNGNQTCETVGTCSGGTCQTGIVGQDCTEDKHCDEDKNDDGQCTQDDCGTNHCISIVGYDDALGAWIVKDNYGTSAGPHNTGFYEVGYGECRIEDYVYYVEVPDIPIPPMISIPGNLTFATTCVGESSYETLNICNTGEENLKVYSIVSDDPQFEVQTLPPSPNPDNPNPDLYPVIISPDFCYPFKVMFSPMDTGTQTATLTISSNDVGHDTVRIEASGIGSQQNIVSMIANSGDYGDVCLGSFKDLNLTINNSGGCDLVVSNISSDSGEFVIPSVSTSLIIHAGDSIQIPIRFQPTSLGSKSATITVDSNDLDTPSMNIPVSGNAPSGNVNTSGELDFGQLCIGESKTQIVKVCDTGKCNLTVTRAELEGSDCDDLTLISPVAAYLPLVISPDFCFDFVVKFQPDDLTPPNCWLAIDTDDPDSASFSIPIAATIGAPNLVIDPAALNGIFAFPATVADEDGTLGCFSERTINLRNNGDCPLTITDISAAGTANAADFSVTEPSGFPVHLPPGEETLSVTVRFTPQADPDPLAPTELTGTLTVVSDDPDGDATAGLCGEGVTQSGVRILVTDISSGKPVPIDEVDMITIQSKGKMRPSPINLMFTDQALNSATICGVNVLYHVDQETLPETDTTGSKPSSSYSSKAMEGNLQASENFTLEQCEFREFQLQLQDSDSEECLLLPKGAACTTDGECCSGKCKGPEGGKTCK